MKLVEEVKKHSSKWMKTIDNDYAKFYWQDGYGIFSVNPSEIEKVVQYIKNQEEHHKKRAFKEELVVFLNKYQVKYDERFLWD
ncbi:transposase IS200 family protein [Flavobacterium araucananum]|nr:transposase IS200 family protein [Flavobacterium araucananum]